MGAQYWKYRTCVGVGVAVSAFSFGIIRMALSSNRTAASTTEHLFAMHCAVCSLTCSYFSYSSFIVDGSAVRVWSSRSGSATKQQQSSTEST